MRRSASLVLLVLALAGCGGGDGGETTSGPSYRALAELHDTPAPPFALRDQEGRAVTLDAERGHWVVLTFLYTTCPDVCPVIAGNLNQALRSAVARRAGLQVISISVDPKRDTPSAARRYVREHGLLPAFRWALGSRARLARVWRAYDVAVLPGPKRTVSHSALQILVDPDGRERLVYDSTVKSSDVVHDLKLLLADE
jgi:protein SCO1/2